MDATDNYELWCVQAERIKVKEAERRSAVAEAAHTDCTRKLMRLLRKHRKLQEGNANLRNEKDTAEAAVRVPEPLPELTGLSTDVLPGAFTKHTETAS
jgi:hypothetical protein